MIDATSIDVEKSIESGWLKTRLPLIDMMQWTVTLIVMSSFVFMAIYFFISTLRLNLNSLAFGSALFGLGLLYLIYRFVTMHKLQKVETMMLAKDIRVAIVEHYTQQKQEIEFDSNDMIFILDNGAKAYLRENASKTTIVLYKNCTAYFCVIQASGSAWSPAILHKWFVGRELRALLS